LQKIKKNFKKKIFIKMSFGNVSRDASVTSLASLRSTASKSANGFFSADIRTVGSLVQYQRSPGVQVTAQSLTVPANQLGNLYTLPFQSVKISLNQNGSVLAVGLITGNPGDSVLSVFTSTAGFYTETSIPLPADANVGPGPFYGEVSLNDAGDVLALSIAQDNNGIGAVWLYVLIAGVWTLTGPKITGPGEIGPGGFGYSLTLNGAGNLLAVGCPYDNNSLGAAYIFNLTSITAPVFVQKLLGTVADGQFGSFVSLSADGSTLAVGAPDYNNTNTPSGNAYIFIYVPTEQSPWKNQFSVLIAPFGMTFFGNSVSLSADGNIFAIGAATNAVIYYRTLGSGWSSKALLPLPYDLVRTTSTNYFVSISQDGNTIGTSDINNNNNEGASWMFTQGPLGTWIQNGPRLVGTGGTPNSNQGTASAVSGDGKVAAMVNNSSELWVFV
jgi:hypothetical protein